MLPKNFPTDYQAVMDWTWVEWQPHYTALLTADLSAENIYDWLEAWTRVSQLTWETRSRLSVAKDVDTTDADAEAAYKKFMATVIPNVQKYSFLLGQKLVDSGITPDDMAVPLRSIRAQIEIFSEDNLPLFVQESELATQYNKISGAQTVEWEGEEVTLNRLRTVFKDTDRDKRETAWRMMQERMRQDRESIDDLWRQYMDLRKQIAANAGFENYRDYIWKDKARFDYTPQDAIAFTEAIEAVVVPVFERLNEQRRQKLGYETLKPWDTAVDPLGRDPLKPYETIEEFIDKTGAIFQQVDPELGTYFQRMQNDNLLDLENRKGKAPGGYCTAFPHSKTPFIFMNSVGQEGDVRTLLHEAGHAFHGFSAMEGLPYQMQMRAPMEFNEVASMAMELLASPYLDEAHGGYFSEAEANRYRAEHLRGIVRFWPYMAIIVAFQHWIYENHDRATDPAACDEKWLELWGRYMKGIDYSGFEDYIVNRWRRQLHIFRVPFYYVEYGLAQLGAVQVWANALDDQQAALDSYRQALNLGGTVTLPELYETAGAKLAFDADTLQRAVDLIERKIADLEGAEPA